jgi:hypothetical protein
MRCSCVVLPCRHYCAGSWQGVSGPLGAELLVFRQVQVQARLPGKGAHDQPCLGMKAALRSAQCVLPD